MSHFKDDYKSRKEAEPLEEAEKALEEGFNVYLEEEITGYTVYVEGSSERPSEEILEDVYRALEGWDMEEEISTYCAVIDRNGFDNVLSLPADRIQGYV